MFNKYNYPLLIVAGLYLSIVSPTSAQIFFEREDIMIASGWKEGPAIETDNTQRQSYRDAGWREKMLAQFPEADADGNGELSEAEAIGYHLRRVRRFTPQGEELAMLDSGVSRWTELVEMRDGVPLPVEVYLPAGNGPWPVVLIRTARGRIDSALDYGNELLRNGYAVVGGDLTPGGDFVNADLLGQREENQPTTREARAALNSSRSNRNAGQDGFDTIAWIAQQPWSNGKIAMSGYSEASAQTKNALALDPPELDLVVTVIGSLARPYGEFAHGRGGRVDSRTGAMPPMPSSWKAPIQKDASTLRGALIEADVVPDVHYNDRTGWFDYPVEGAIMEWLKMKSNGRSTLIMGIGGHGSTYFPARMHPNYGDSDLLLPEIGAFKILTDEGHDSRFDQSMFYYFLMGDATDPKAPGNVWKETDHWPVADKTESWWMTADGTLSQSQPTGENESLSYTYDPRNPVKTAGGNRMPSLQNGPIDQRPLDSRSDVLLFQSEPLQEPVEITGSAKVELYISTDAPDTAFVVQLLDIYPDGYKWPIRDGQVIARFHEKGDASKPLQSNEIYKLEIELVPTALMLAPGHRLGIQVMSSHFPAYEIHPNVWDDIESYDEAAVARQSIHLSGKHASRIILPVVSPGKSRDYQP